jgi:hypothetical protein
LLQAARKVAHRLVRAVADREQVQRAVDFFVQIAQAKKPAGEAQILAAGQIAVKKTGVGDESDGGLAFRRVLVKVLFAEKDLPFGGLGERREDSKQGGFTGAVRAVNELPKYLETSRSSRARSA